MLGGLIGDVIGAAVEAESAGYIRKAFKDVDAILALKTVPELLSGEWEVGRFTDDTQMTLCVAEWLVSDPTRSGRQLLERFCGAYEPWRHYASGTRMILESFPNAKEKWASLATAMFPDGSYGNGSAMRVAPVGLMLHNDLPGLIEVARLSSSVTHSHYLAVQGAALQAAAVATAIRGTGEGGGFLGVLKTVLARFEALGQNTVVYQTALNHISQGISKNEAPERMSQVLGNGIKAQEAVPMAIYCFLGSQRSFEKALESAIFLGGDTDTIASMTGAIAGAALGAYHIPKRWLDRVTEPEYGPNKIREVARALHSAGLKERFKSRR